MGFFCLFVFSVRYTFHSACGWKPDAFLESHPSSASFIMPGRVASPRGPSLRQRATPPFIPRDLPPPRWLVCPCQLWVSLYVSGALVDDTAGAESPALPRLSPGACRPFQAIVTRLLPAARGPCPSPAFGWDIPRIPFSLYTSFFFFYFRMTLWAAGGVSWNDRVVPGPRVPVLCESHSHASTRNGARCRRYCSKRTGIGWIDQE